VAAFKTLRSNDLGSASLMPEIDNVAEIERHPEGQPRVSALAGLNGPLSLIRPAVTALKSVTPRFITPTRARCIPGDRQR
jgi:hypothetical protein